MSVVSNSISSTVLTVRQPMCKYVEKAVTRTTVLIVVSLHIITVLMVRHFVLVYFLCTHC